MADIEEITKALGPKNLALLSLEEGPDAVGIRKKKFLSNDSWKEINDILRGFGGRWSSEKQGWIVPVDSKPQPQFKPPEKVRTGLSKIDAHLDQIETEKAEEEKVAGRIVLVEADRIRPNKYNPNEMSDEEFNALLENMKKEGSHGTSPLEVRPLNASTWEIVDGFHRWKAAKLLGWNKIRCIVREVDEDRAQEINYEKNRLRGHINPFKEAEMFNAKWKKLMRQDDVAKKFGVTQPYVADALSLIKIPDEVREIIARAINRPSPRVLRILATIDPIDQEILAKKIASPEGCTVREAEAFAKGLGTEEETIEKAKEVVLQLVDGEEEKVPAAQVTKVKEATVKKAGKAPTIEWRVEFRNESGMLCSRDVTDRCGLELEKLGFPVERTEAPSEPEMPMGVPMNVSILRHSPADAHKDAWYELSYVVEAPNLHLGSGHPFDVEQDWEQLIEGEAQRVEKENQGIRIRPEIVNDYRQWPPEQTLENRPKGPKKDETVEKGAGKVTEKDGEKGKEDDRKEGQSPKAQFCPVCNSPMSPSAYERLKEKFKAFRGLFQ